MRAAALVASAVLLAAGRPASEDAHGPSRLADRLGPVEVGKPLPSFAGPTADGTFALGSFLRERRPRAVVVTVFATWCTACAKLLPRAAEAVRGEAESGVALVVVDVGEDDEEAARQWLAANGVLAGEGGASIVLDPFQKISADRLGVTALPRTFVLDGAGKVRAIFAHEGEDYPAVLRREVARVRAEAR